MRALHSGNPGYRVSSSDLANNLATPALSEARQKRETSPRSSRSTAKVGSRVGAGFVARTIPSVGIQNREEWSCTKRRSPYSRSTPPPSRRRARRRSASRRGVEPPATAPRGRRGTDRPPCVRAPSRYREAHADLLDGRLGGRLHRRPRGRVRVGGPQRGAVPLPPRAGTRARRGFPPPPAPRDEGGVGGGSGAGLAAQAIELGLVDELRIFRYPVVVGGGTPYLPPVTENVRLDLIESRTFNSRVIYERYQRVGGVL